MIHCARFTIVCLLTASLLCSGCYDPTADSAKTTGGAAKQEKEITVEDADLVFKLDADNCDIKWTGSNQAGMTPHGFFYELTGKMVVDGKSKKLKHVEIDIVMSSVKAMNEALTEKLKNHGFFEVKKYPESKFVVTSVLPRRDDDKEDVTDVLEANFQLRDTTKSIQIPVTFELDEGKKMATLSSSFSLNRKDYGVVYENSVEDVLIRDNVLINLDIEAERQE